MQQPNLQGDVSQKTDEYLRQVTNAISSLQVRAAKIEQSGYITKSQAQTLYNPGAVSKSLQADGTAPLSITGLPGRAAEPQNAAAPTVSSLPAYGNPLAQDGALVSFNGVVYRYNGLTSPGQWLAIGAAAVLTINTHAYRLAHASTTLPLNTLFYESDRTVFYAAEAFWVYLSGVMVGGIATRPADLGTHDVGFLFLSNDAGVAAVLYRWSGIAWASVNLSAPVSQTVTSNVIGTVYHNTLPSSRTVTVTLQAGGAAVTGSILCDSASTPVTIIIPYNITASQYNTYTFTVPPGFFYKVVTATGTTSVGAWVEYS